jgi:uncharacterized protein DUF5667
MHRSQPDKLHDELDALLDGRPVELTDELAPLVEAADALRGELAYQLDPEVADRHLERVLGSPANVVPMPTRPQPSGWEVRRRVVAVALAAALVLAPATMASAAALPGQAMYPFKLAIEQLRLAAVQWSPSREAGERTRVADERLNEVQDLLELEMYSQLPTAIRALKLAVVEAQRAVEEAQKKGELAPSVALKLIQVQQNGYQVLSQARAKAAKGAAGLSGNTAKEIQAAVQDASPTVSPPPTTTDPKSGGTGTVPPTQPTATAPGGQGPGTTSPASQTTTQTTNQPETSTSQATTTTTTPTTTVPTTTTAPTTTEDTGTPASPGGDTAGGAGQAGAGDPGPLGYVPPTTAPPTSAP